MWHAFWCGTVAVLISATAPGAASGHGLGLSGSVSRISRGPFPAGAVLEVRLVNARSHHPTTASIAATRVTTRGGEDSVAFQLPYDAARIVAGHSYRLRATVTRDGDEWLESEIEMTAGHGAGFAPVHLVMITAGPAPAPTVAIQLAAADSFYALADSMRARLGTLREISGVAEVGGSVCHWTAHFSGDDLRHVTETIDSEPYGTRSNEYAFEGGTLRVFLSHGDHSLTDPNDPDQGPYRLRIAFDAAGGTRRADKTVAGRLVMVAESEPAGVRARVEWLREIVRRATHH